LIAGAFERHHIRRPKQLVADLTLDKHMLQDVIRKSTMSLATSHQMKLGSSQHQFCFGTE
jgi:hypothetical protein